jgi:SAM-dependent methyltransferase
MRDFSQFDTRRYPTVSVREGYAEWAGHYEGTVDDEMDLRLLRRAQTVVWPTIREAVDLACGSGRIGSWLASKGVRQIDGVDITPEMMALAQTKGVYRRIVQADVANTGLDGGRYDLVVQSLADEHLADLGPLYHEAARLTTPTGSFVIVGYHPHFLMLGIPTHYHRRDDDEPVAIRSYVHLTSDHVKAAHAAGFTLAEMDESVVDASWLETRPKWAHHRDRPVTFLMTWRKR